MHQRERHSSSSDIVSESSKEKEKRVRVEVYDPQAFARLVLDEHDEPLDRFKSPEDGGAFRLFFPEFLHDPNQQTAKYIALFEGETIAGIGKLRQSPTAESVYEPSVSVDPAFQGKEYGKRLMEEQCKLARELGWKLTLNYTRQGRKHLKPHVKKLVSKYGVELIEDPFEQYMPAEE